MAAFFSSIAIVENWKAKIFSVAMLLAQIYFLLLTATSRLSPFNLSLFSIYVSVSFSNLSKHTYFELILTLAHKNANFFLHVQAKRAYVK